MPSEADTETCDHPADAVMWNEYNQVKRYWWGDRCPNCRGVFPFLHGPHPTWIPCEFDANQ